MFSAYQIAIVLITYLICSISPSIIICKLRTGQDIRELGSGNAGTTNSLRVLGKFWGAVVFILDIAKVFAAYGILLLVAKMFNQDSDFTLKSIFIVTAVLGHCYPAYYGFKGGKGVTVGMIGVFLISYKIALVCLAAGIVIILVTRMVSAGSIGGTLLLDIMSLVMLPQYLVPVLTVSAIIIFKHRANIKRIAQNQENKLW